MRWEKNTEHTATEVRNTWTLGEGKWLGDLLLIPICRVRLVVTVAETTSKCSGGGAGGGAVDPVAFIVVPPEGRPRLEVLLEGVFEQDGLTWERFLEEAPQLQDELRARLAAAGITRDLGNPLPPTNG